MYALDNRNNLVYSECMILSAKQIHEDVLSGKIHISPFNIEHLGPNSYDITLGNQLLVYRQYREFPANGGIYKYHNLLDSKSPNETVELLIPESGRVLEPGTLYLGITNEEAGSDYYVPMLEGRSSLARLGVSIHVTAGFGDVGFKSRWTLEITVVHPTIIYPNQRVGQVYFMEPKGPVEKLYSGKYTKQDGPVASKMWEDK